MTVTFELDGQEFIALNGGPQFRFTEAISFVVNCETRQVVKKALIHDRRTVEVRNGLPYRASVRISPPMDCKFYFVHY